MDKKTHKRALVFFSAGVGDAILLVPLVNSLKNDGFAVTGLFTSKFQCESIFENTNLFESVIVKGNKYSLLLFSALNVKAYTHVFLNHFAFSRLHITCAALLGKLVFTNYAGPFSLKSKPTIKVIDPIPNIHDALQNVFLWSNLCRISELDFNLHISRISSNIIPLPDRYIVVQTSSANSKAPYKNWEIQKWIELLTHLKNRLPNIHFVLLGDHSEKHITEQMKELGSRAVTSLIGQTSLSDVVDIMTRSLFYLGLDSGLMHIAAALKKPTFTIWGASNPVLYGYEQVDAEKHTVVSLHLPCAPCSAWIGSNKSRVSDPLECPDIKCLADLTANRVKIDLDYFLAKKGFL